MNPSFEQFGIWMACALIALDAYIRWAQYRLQREQREDGLQPIHVQLKRDFATKEDVERLEAEMREYRATEIQDAAQRRKEIYARLENMRKEFTDEIGKVHTRVDAVPDRVIALLKNTNVIKP